MFRAGFAGEYAIRAVLLSIGDRPKIFGIMVGQAEKWTSAVACSQLVLLVMMQFALCPTQCRARVDNGSLRPRLDMLVTMHLGCVPLGCRRPKIFCILVGLDLSCALSLARFVVVFP